MKLSPLFLTDLAVGRLIKEFAIRLGIDEDLADVLAIKHYEQSSIPRSWSNFIESNCSRCEDSPGSCSYLNPTVSNCSGASPENMQTAIAVMIERGSQVTCPLLSISNEA